MSVKMVRQMLQPCFQETAQRCRRYNLHIASQKLHMLGKGVPLPEGKRARRRTEVLRTKTRAVKYTDIQQRQLMPLSALSDTEE